jgi:hypothetical protein
MAPEFSQFGFQGLLFRPLSLRSAVIGVVNDLRIPAHLKQGRGKVLLVFERQKTSRNPVLQSDLAVVNQKREASLGERVDLSVSCTRKEV